MGQLAFFAPIFENIRSENIGCHRSYLQTLIFMISTSLIFCLCTGSNASDIINISKAAPLDPKQTITLESPQLKTRVTIQNLTDQTQEVVLVSAPFLELDGKGTIPAIWTFMLGNELVTINDSPITKKLQPKTEYPVTLSASFDVPGNYRALLTASENKKEGLVLSRLAVDVVLSPQLLTPNSLVAPSAAYLHECGMEDYGLCKWKPVHISTYLQNTTSKTLTIKEVAVSQLVVKKNGQDIAIPNPEAILTTCGSNDAPISLTPSATCQINLELKVPGAGDYSVKLNTVSVAGGAVDNSVSLKVRHSWFLCAIILAIGAGIGLVVREWRGQGRMSAVAIFDITRTSELLRSIKLAAPDANKVLLKILGDSDRLRGEYASGEQKDSVAATAFRARSLAFLQWNEYEIVFNGLISDEQNQVRSKRNESLQLLGKIDSTASALQESLDTFRSTLEALEISRILLKQRGILKDLKDKYWADLDNDAKSSGSDELKKAAEAVLINLEKTFNYLDSAGYERETANQKIAEVQYSLAQYLSLKGIIKKGADSVLPIDISVVTPMLLSWIKPDDDSSKILAKIRRWDYWVNAIGFLIVLLVGVQALWLPSLTWGSSGDYLTAFLAAAGLQFGYGSAISELRTGFSTGIK